MEAMKMRNVFASLLFLGALSQPVLAQDTPPNRITVRIVPGITSWQQLPSRDLVNARKALTQGQDIGWTRTRQLADLGDGFAALRFAQALEESDNIGLTADTAHYFGVAAATGRGGAISGLVRALDHLDRTKLSRGRADVLKDILLTYAKAGNSHAVDAVMRYQVTQEPFGAIDDDMVSLMVNATGEGAAQLGLQLALSILGDTASSTQDLLRAQDYLVIAETATSLETLLVAQNTTPLLKATLQARPDLGTAVEALRNSADPTVPSQLTPMSRPTTLTEVTQ